LKKYTDIPREIDQSSIDLTQCNDTTTEKVIATCDENVTGENCAITCKDGVQTKHLYSMFTKLELLKLLQVIV